MITAIESLSDDVLFGVLSEAPDLAMTLGLEQVNGRRLPSAELPDFSDEGAARRQQLIDSWARRLSCIPAELDDSTDSLTRQTLEYVLEHGFLNRFNGHAGFEYSDHLDPVTHLSSVHTIAVDMLASDGRLNDADDASRHIERLARLPQALRQTSETLQRRRARGFVAPRQVLGRAIADMRASLGVATSAHPFYRGLGNSLLKLPVFAARALLERAASIIEDGVSPAYATLLDELEAHRAVGREAISANSRPGGEEFYSWRFAGHSTTALRPERAYQLGREELERLHGELRQVFARLGYPDSLADAFRRVASEDAFPEGAAGRGEILAAARTTVAAAKDMMRPLFSSWPDTDVAVQPIAPEHEQSMHSHYIPPHGTPLRGGVFWLNLAQSAAQPRRELAVASYHETWPGHHLQMALAQQAELPALRRVPLFTAYMEGWAKYAEGLAVSTALGDDLLAQVAVLRSELYSTATLVLDTGVHVHGWSFDAALRFFMEQTFAPRRLAEMVVYRCAAEPAQLCAYKIGLLAFRGLKMRLADALGESFRLQGFHAAVLGSGALPLEVLERAVLAPTGTRSHSHV
jgi:uncharacterized protein (DUF885 family)